jgi:hypothetical protein
LRCDSLVDSSEGRVTQSGLVGNITDNKSSKQPLRPDEVLFKQSNAPPRYEETDYYQAHTRLPAGQQLPSGDLLSAIHAYISKLYSRTGDEDDPETWKCMDETALIALGILLEETAREALGETGDFAFLEAADEEETDVSSSDSETADDEQAAGTDLQGTEEERGTDRSSPSGDDSRYSAEDSH